jgi:lipopolysaccharide/colanic/teichoic acid biosynthesis glycosyltransferase
MLKRLFDICFALCALAVSAPVLLGVSLWVAFDSRGPVLFRQQRVGLRGKLFSICKFRTMRADVSGIAPQLTAGADPRITRAGAFLRKYKLDELPQFFNVLVGDMSVVGPRPEVPRYVALYPPEARELILSVRPGITDLASITYRDESLLLGQADDPEALYVREILPAKLELCIRYVTTRNLRLDLAIMWRTMVAILAGNESRRDRQRN